MKDINKIKELVALQAEDWGLWFLNAKTASEIYLQSELRKLHRAIEEEFGDCRLKELEE